MNKILNDYNNNVTTYKHKRSHSVGLPIKVDQLFLNRTRTNIKLENCNAIQSETEYSLQKMDSVRRKSMGSIKLKQQILVPTTVMHTFDQCCNYEEHKNIKEKQIVTFEAFKVNNSCKLNKLISEYKDIENKLEKLHLANVEIKNELEYLKETNDHFKNQNKYFSNKYNTLKILNKENKQKMKKIINKTELPNKNADCELSILKINGDITVIQNYHNIGKHQGKRIEDSLHEINSTMLKQIKYLKTFGHIGIEYLNYLNYEVYNDISNNQNEYILQNKNLKSRYSDLKNKLNKMNNTFYMKNKTSILLLNICLYFLFLN